MKNLDKIIVAKLPTPLINLIGRQISMDTDIISENAGKMLSKIDWSRARDEERLAYAELMYLKGTKILSTMGTDGVVKKLNKVWEENNGCLYVDGHSDELGDVVLEIWNRHKWAEIIEESVASIGNIGDKKNTESVEYIGLRPEFKAGDEVEVRYNVWNKGEWRKRTYCCFLFGRHWCRYGSELEMVSYDEIRKPDPDKELREIAKELIKKYVKGTASSGKGGVFSPYKISEYVFEDNGLEQMLIEMGKRVEALKKAKNL